MDTTTNTVTEKLTSEAKALGLPLHAVKVVSTFKSAAAYLFRLDDETDFASFENLTDGTRELARLEKLYGESLRASKKNAAIAHNVDLAAYGARGMLPETATVEELCQETRATLARFNEDAGRMGQESMDYSGVTDEQIATAVRGN